MLKFSPLVVKHVDYYPDYITGYSALAFKWTANDMETLTKYISYRIKLTMNDGYRHLFKQGNTPILSDGQHTFPYMPSTMTRNPSRIVTFDFTTDTV